VTKGKARQLDGKGEWALGGANLDDTAGKGVKKNQRDKPPGSQWG